MAPATKPGEITGEIHADGAYTIVALDQKFGIGKGALRQAHRQGLIVRHRAAFLRVGKRRNRLDGK